MTSAVQRVLALVVEPEEPRSAGDVACATLDVGVTGLSSGCGTSTVAQGLRRELPAARVIDGLGPGPAGVLVVVAGRSALPVLARLVTDRLCERHSSVVLAANRPEDPQEWEQAGAVCLPQSRLGVTLLARGHRPPGSFGAAIRTLAGVVAAEARV